LFRRGPIGDFLADILPAVVVVVLGFVCVLAIGRLGRMDAGKESAFKAAQVVLETPLGVEVEYRGHRILYAGLSHSQPEYDDIELRIDGRPLVLSPGASLAEVKWRSQKYAFFLPDGQKLILKEVSGDRSVLRWTDTDWEQK